MATVVGFDQTAKLRCTCRNCSAVVEYTKGEVQERHGKDYSGGPDGAKWVNCPNCGQKIILESW